MMTQVERNLQEAYIETEIKAAAHLVNELQQKQAYYRECMERTTKALEPLRQILDEVLLLQRWI